MEEEWKAIAVYPGYFVSTHGRVKLTLGKNEKILKHTILSGYYSVGVTNKINNKQKTAYVHKLVALTFIKNPYNLAVIDHIDRDRLNNNVTNLRWFSYSDNSKNSIKCDTIIQYNLDGSMVRRWKSLTEICENTGYKLYRLRAGISNLSETYGFLWERTNRPVQHIIDNEIFENIGIIDDFDLSRYEISNYGRVRETKRGKFLALCINPSGYYLLSLSDKDGKARSFSVHRLVALTFIANPNNLPIINHIDENKVNNRVDNLQWVTSSGNMTHSLGKRVQQLDKSTSEVIQTYNSVVEASKALNIDPSNISKACRGVQKTAYGFGWRYLEQ